MAAAEQEFDQQAPEHAESGLPPRELPTVEQLRNRVVDTAFAFRGYNISNLGRSFELLECPQYAEIIVDHLQRASAVCHDVTGKPTNLVARVRQKRDTSLATYHEAIALIVSMSLAQIEILRTIHKLDTSRARLVYGFSLGEITALVAGGVLTMENALRIPIALAEDSVALAHDVTLGVLFSRTEKLSLDAVSQLCQDINQAGNGVIGVSALLAPNSMLIIGQRDTLDRFSQRRSELTADRSFIRKNDHRWPPLHTPIVWERQIPNRAQYLMHTMPCSFASPLPNIFSLVTGDFSYRGTNTRELIGQWVDHPQRLWNAVDTTLSLGVKYVAHVGPAPNIIPATFERLKTNVQTQVAQKLSMRALSGMVRRPWVKAMLPKRTNLLRAPEITQFHLEDWLIHHAPSS